MNILTQKRVVGGLLLAMGGFMATQLVTEYRVGGHLDTEMVIASPVTLMLGLTCILAPRLIPFRGDPPNARHPHAWILQFVIALAGVLAGLWIKHAYFHPVK